MEGGTQVPPVTGHSAGAAPGSPASGSSSKGTGTRTWKRHLPPGSHSADRDGQDGSLPKAPSGDGCGGCGVRTRRNVIRPCEGDSPATCATRVDGKTDRVISLPRGLLKRQTHRGRGQKSDRRGQGEGTPGTRWPEGTQFRSHATSDLRRPTAALTACQVASPPGRAAFQTREEVGPHVEGPSPQQNRDGDGDRDQWRR